MIFSLRVSRFPFDWKSPTGYLAAILIQWPQTLVTIVQATTILILIFGLCAFSLNFTLDLEQSLREFNEIATAQHHSNEQRMELKQKFNVIAQFHADAKELRVDFSNCHLLRERFLNFYISFRFVINFSDSVSGLLASYLIFILVSLCSLLLQFNTVLLN